MKRITIFIFFLFFIGTSIYAQDYAKWRFGLKASPNISWFNPEIRELEYDKTSFGFSYGMIGDRHFSESYAISSGLFITQHGGQISFQENVHEVDGNSLKKRLYKLQYVDLPFVIKMRTREIGYFTYYGQFGASLGYNIRAKADDEYYNNPNETDVDIIDVTHLFKGSLIMGAGAEYSLLGNTAIVIGLYYNNGFTNPFDMGSYNGKKISARSNFVELTVGMLF